MISVCGPIGEQRRPNCDRDEWQQQHIDRGCENTLFQRAPKSSHCALEPILLHRSPQEPKRTAQCIWNHCLQPFVFRVHRYNAGALAVDQ